VCSHAIWCEVRSIGAFCFVVYFNDEQSSNTYMEPVTTCPGCGRGLADHVGIEEYPYYKRRELENGDVYYYAPLWQLDESDPEMLKLYEGVRQSVKKDDIHDVDSASETAARQAGIWQENEPHSYKPLIDEPDLFLKFARLVEEGPVTENVMLEWVGSYGVLGLDKSAGTAMGSPRGGPQENVLSFGERAGEPTWS